MRTLLSILTIIILAASCTPATYKTNQENYKFETLPLPLDSTAFYFKTKGSWEDTTNNALDTFVNTWYSKMLFALKEPILKNYHGDKEIYRFTWLRTFHHPVSVRLEKQGDIVKLFTKVCSGAGGYEPSQLIFDTTINATTEQLKTIQQKIYNINFWNLATEQHDDGGKDGSEWIIEAIKANKYHMVTRWTPSVERLGNFRSVGEYLISIAGLNNEEMKFTY